MQGEKRRKVHYGFMVPVPHRPSVYHSNDLTELELLDLMMQANIERHIGNNLSPELRAQAKIPEGDVGAIVVMALNIQPQGLRIGDPIYSAFQAYIVPTSALEEIAEHALQEIAPQK